MSLVFRKMYASNITAQPKHWRRPVGEWINKLVHPDNGYYSALERKQAIKPGKDTRSHVHLLLCHCVTQLYDVLEKGKTMETEKDQWLTEVDEREWMDRQSTEDV